MPLKYAIEKIQKTIEEDCILMGNLAGLAVKHRDSYKQRYKITQEALNLIKEYINADIDIGLTEHSNISRIMEEAEREVKKWEPSNEIKTNCKEDFTATQKQEK